MGGDLTLLVTLPFLGSPHGNQKPSFNVEFALFEAPDVTGIEATGGSRISPVYGCSSSARADTRFHGAKCSWPCVHGPVFQVDAAPRGAQHPFLTLLYRWDGSEHPHSSAARQPPFKSMAGAGVAI